jgi:hypothetical protein
MKRSKRLQTLICARGAGSTACVGCSGLAMRCSKRLDRLMTYGERRSEPSMRLTNLFDRFISRTLAPTPPAKERGAREKTRSNVLDGLISTLIRRSDHA